MFHWLRHELENTLYFMVRNVHERVLPASACALIDTLSSSDDRLWPRATWPAQRFDRPLGVGAVGGHGPVRYDVVAYEPGRRVRFRFLGPAGFDGHHEYEAVPAGAGCVLRHTLVVRPRGGPGSRGRWFTVRCMTRCWRTACFWRR